MSERGAKGKGGEKIKKTIEKLVLEHYYLPYATVTDLVRIPSSKLCTTIEDVRRRAIEILTNENMEAEIYRQLIYMLSVHTAVTGLMPYIMAVIRTRALKSPFSSTIYDVMYKELELSNKNLWRKRGYKKAVEIYADLVQLNFAYMPLEHIFDEALMSWKKPTERKVLVSTLQSRALIGRMPLKPFEPSSISYDEAEKIVAFCTSLRQRVIEGFLKLRPLKAGDIFQHVYQWAKKEVERLEKYHHLIRMLDRSIYEELFIAPYYLKHYGIINIDLIRYELFWELG
jgi:hypothetical protein